MLSHQILLGLFLTLTISSWKPVLSQSSEDSSDSREDYSSGRSPMFWVEPLSITNLTIFIVGRNGSGVSSTIRELLGPHANCQAPAPDGGNPLKTLIEYTLKIPSSERAPQYTIKLVDIPEFLDGKPSEIDAQLLASMKSYTNQNGFPDYYLALSSISDKHVDDEDSPFFHFLKRIELFQQVYFERPGISDENHNIVFLLTKLMSERKGRQRRPESKIKIFREVIEDYTSYSSEVKVIVGENDAGKYFNTTIENGYYKLPNDQLYPKNIWEALRHYPTSYYDDVSNAKKEALLVVEDNRENINVSCEARAVSTDWGYLDDDAFDYLYLLQQTNITAQKNEVNDKIQHEFNKSSPLVKEQHIVQKLALQLRLQNMNISTINDLQRTVSQQPGFFETNRFSSGVSALLLAEAFGMGMPKYNKSLNVGYGYDLIADELIPQSPFRADTLRPSNVGYELPSFLSCRKLFEPEIKYYKSYSQNIGDYTTERLQYLHFEGKENASVYKLRFKLKEGFNLKPNDDGDNVVVTLSAVQEIRTVKCSLDKEHLYLNEEIVEAINSMTEFDQTKRDSVNEWRSFFFKFGSHIVTESFGGGIMKGRLVGPNVRNILVSENLTDSVLNSIVKFTNFSDPDLQTPSYIIYGGTPNAQLFSPYEVSNETRKLLLNAWTEGLRSDFIMLNYELGLEPISTFIKLYNQEKGEFVEKAIELFLLKGDLKYSRRGNNVNRNLPKRLTTTKTPFETNQLGEPKMNRDSNKAQLSTEQRQREEQRRLALEQMERMRETLRLQAENHEIRYKQLLESLTPVTQNPVSSG